MFGLTSFDVDLIVRGSQLKMLVGVVAIMKLLFSLVDLVMLCNKFMYFCLNMLDVYFILKIMNFLQNIFAVSFYTKMQPNFTICCKEE